MHLNASAENNCLILHTNLSIEENIVDPDQAAHIGSARSGSTLFVKETSETFQQTTKADKG